MITSLPKALPLGYKQIGFQPIPHSPFYRQRLKDLRFPIPHSTFYRQRLKDLRFLTPHFIAKGSKTFGSSFLILSPKAQRPSVPHSSFLTPHFIAKGSKTFGSSLLIPHSTFYHQRLKDLRFHTPHSSLLIPQNLHPYISNPFQLIFSHSLTNFVNIYPLLRIMQIFFIIIDIGI